MQQTMAPRIRYRRGIAITSGGTLGVLAGVIILGIGILGNIQLITGINTVSTIFAIILLCALFAAPPLAALIGTVRSGRFGIGILASLWSGFFIALFLDILMVVLYFIKPTTLITAQTAQQAQSALAQYGITVPAQSLQTAGNPQITLVSIAFAGILLIIVWLGLGAFLGVLGATIGKIFVHHPRDIIIEDSVSPSEDITERNVYSQQQRFYPQQNRGPWHPQR